MSEHGEYSTSHLYWLVACCYVPSDVNIYVAIRREADRGPNHLELGKQEQQYTSGWCRRREGRARLLRPAGHVFSSVLQQSQVKISTAARPPCFVAVKFRGVRRSIELSGVLCFAWSVSAGTWWMPITKSLADSISHVVTAPAVLPLPADRARPDNLGFSNKKPLLVTHDRSGRDDDDRIDGVSFGSEHARQFDRVPSRTQLFKRKWEGSIDGWMDRWRETHARTAGWSSWTGRARGGGGRVMSANVDRWRGTSCRSIDRQQQASSSQFPMAIEMGTTRTNGSLRWVEGAQSCRKWRGSEISEKKKTSMYGASRFDWLIALFSCLYS